MKGAKKTTLIIAMALFIGIIFIRTNFAGNTISLTVRCTVPQFITLASGENVLVGSEEAIKATSLSEKQTEPQENEKMSIVAQSNSKLIKQQEKIVLEDSNEIQLVTTVCAK